MGFITASSELPGLRSTFRTAYGSNSIRRMLPYGAMGIDLCSAPLPIPSTQRSKP